MDGGAAMEGLSMATADETLVFTDREFGVIFGVCWRLPKREIAQKRGITGDGVVQNSLSSIFDKAGLSSRIELLLWVRTTLNEELRRRATLWALEDIAQEASAFDLAGCDPAAAAVIRNVRRKAMEAIDKARG